MNDGADSPSGPQADSPSVRKQPKRVVKPRVYFDLVDYDSDLDDIAGQSSFSPARRRATGPRLSPGNTSAALNLSYSLLFFLSKHRKKQEKI